MSDSGESSDLDHICWDIPLPSAEHIARELEDIEPFGLLARDLATFQHGTNALHNIMLLAVVRLDVQRGHTLAYRLAAVVDEAIDEISDSKTLNIVRAMFGAPDFVAPQRERLRTAIEYAEIVARKSAGTGTREQLTRANNTFARRYRRPALLALAEQVLKIESDFRKTRAVDAVGELVRPVAPRLIVDWLPRLEDYKGMADELDSLLGDLTSWRRHITGADVLNAERMTALMNSSLYRLAYFEFRYTQFEADRKSFWIFADPDIEEPFTEAMWRLRLLTRLPEAWLSWLAYQIGDMAIPGLWAFQERVEGMEMGTSVRDRWILLFSYCKCRKDFADPMSETCPVHQLVRYVEVVVRTEAEHRNRVMSWITGVLAQVPDKPAQDRLETLEEINTKVQGKRR